MLIGGIFTLRVAIMSRTFKDKEPRRGKAFKRNDRYEGFSGDTYDPSSRKKVKRELSRANRRLLKQEGIVE